MINKNKTRLNNPEYAKSAERMQKLQEIIVEGEDAKTLLVFASKFLEIVERETLDALKTKTCNYEETVAYYKAAVRFVDMLKYAAELGDKKAQAYMELMRDTK